MFLRWLFLSYFFLKMNCSNPFNIFFPFQPLGIIIDILNYYFEERFLVPMMTSKKIFCRHHTHHLHTICVTLAILLCFDVYFPINSNDYFEIICLLLFIVISILVLLLFHEKIFIIINPFSTVWFHVISPDDPLWLWILSDFQPVLYMTRTSKT